MLSDQNLSDLLIPFIYVLQEVESLEQEKLELKLKYEQNIKILNMQLKQSRKNNITLR